MIDDQDARGTGAASKEVTDAIENTPMGDLQSTLDLHARSWNDTSFGTLAWMQGAEWVRYEHPNVLPPAVGYKAVRQGFQLVMPVSELEDTEEVFFDPPSAKSEASGFVMGNVRGHSGPVVEHVVALVGPGDDGKPVLWTVHAGDPIIPSRVAKEFAEITVSVAEAKRMEVHFVRCLPVS